MFTKPPNIIVMFLVPSAIVMGVQLSNALAHLAVTWLCQSFVPERIAYRSACLYLFRVFLLVCLSAPASILALGCLSFCASSVFGFSSLVAGASLFTLPIFLPSNLSLFRLLESLAGHSSSFWICLRVPLAVLSTIFSARITGLVKAYRGFLKALVWLFVFTHSTFHNLVSLGWYRIPRLYYGIGDLSNERI